MATRRARSAERKRVERKRKASSERRKVARALARPVVEEPPPPPGICIKCGVPVVCIKCKGAMVCTSCAAISEIHVDACPNCKKPYEACMTDRTCMRFVAA